ncbi:Transmembrane protein 19 [Portunus trituberculatus]|uniref:Transmembrane protein 19 n=1 Tax=Portunus trituberculatus TaxID=210409 RepID=A0A5B7GNN3_PORTR|nr:Transmembrane protein 19 [Portunus trituberculatus]
MRQTFLLLLFITLPISVVLWFVNAFVSSTIGGSVIEPSRWLSATLLPVIVAWWGLRKKSLSFSGAVCGGERNWVQVMCNGGVASLIAWFYIVDCGCGENPVDLIYSYRCSWLSVAVLGL